ncbi:MAG TPA: hypothetical protein VH877_25390 [Polyangia bacterium]|nr:hypothetical protein [Polyangia bacterium]
MITTDMQSEPISTDGMGLREELLEGGFGDVTIEGLGRIIDRDEGGRGGGLEGGGRALHPS